ncbi:MAG TPA: MIP/aquaporin family protein [Bacteroidota bacterium]
MNTKALVAEFIGTFTLIFIGVGAIASNVMSGNMLGLTGIALAHGLAIGVMVSATAAVSGGHLNPAVTFGALVTGKIDIKNGIGYIVAQCLGGIVAAYAIKLAIPEQALVATNFGLPVVTRGITVLEAFSTETILTFFLVFVVFGTAIDKRAPKVGGLFIGLAVAMGVMMGGAVSGAAMNPARHLGPAIAGGGFENIWLYWAGPLLGGALAGFVYKYGLGEKES